MDEPLVFVGQPHPRGNVARVDRYGSGMAGRVTIARVECRNEGRRKRQARTLETSVGLLEASHRFTLLLVEMNQTLQCNRWNQERSYDCYGIELISVYE